MKGSAQPHPPAPGAEHAPARPRNSNQKSLIERGLDTESPLTRNESRTAFVEWAKANPDVLPIPPLEGIVRASKELYPCS